MKKTAATPVSSSSAGAILNTLINPFAAVGPGEYYLPESISSPGKHGREAPLLPFTGNPTYDKILFHGAAVGLTAFSLMALARLAVHSRKRDEEDRLRRENLREQIAARAPVFSPDPGVADITEEEKQRELGIPKQAVGGLEPWLKVLVPLTLMAGGSYLGYAGMDKYLERRDRRRVQREVAELRNQLDRVNYERLMGARNLDPYADEEAAPASLPKEAQTPGGESYIDTAKAFLALLFASTAVTSGIMVKRYFDETSGPRREARIFNRALQQLSAEEQAKAPVGVMPLPEEVRQRLNAHLVRSSSAGRRKVISAGLPPEAEPVALEAAAPVRRLEAAPVDIRAFDNDLAADIPRDPKDRTMALL